MLWTPGIHRNVPDAEYHALEGASHHRLSIIHDYHPAMLKYRLENPEEPSDNMVLGSALHCYVLEKDKFDERFCVAPKVDKRTKVGKAEWEAFCAANVGKTPITPYQYEQVIGMYKSISLNPDIAPLLANAVEKELVVLWEHEGVKCKAKMDLIAKCHPERIVVDIKTTENCNVVAFSREAKRYGYVRQMQFYNWATNHFEEMLCFGRPSFIVVERKPPFTSALFQVPVGEIAKDAFDEEMALLDIYAECEKSGVWPGPKPQDIVDIPE